MVENRTKTVSRPDGALLVSEGLAFGLLVAILGEWILGGGITRGVQNLSFGKILENSVTLAGFYVFVGSIPKFKRKSRDLIALVCVIFSQVVIIALGQALAYSLFKSSGSWSILSGFKQESLYFGLPLASGPLLLQLVLGIRHSLICTLTLGFLVQNYLPEFPILMLHSLLTALVGCLSLKRVRSRSAYSKAGFFMFLTSLIVVVCFYVTSGHSSAEVTSNVDLTVLIISAFIGSVLAFLITSGFSPLLEVLGGYVTDMRLLEMATLDHPLLKEVSIQASGTWNHSMVMGMMTEAAADAVGANPVLAKVGAYFHDIGKSKKPIYFVENQFGGENRHDRLSPSMSALIIRSHVKDGLEMARRHSLPQVIMDMISQHHGTSTIEYFYDKALKEAEQQDNAGEVDKSHYQYPGPKPQTREAGIMMLADGIEAASRTMHDPSFDRIQGMVQKMINKVFSSGQLEECELTLLDLHHIARCFTRVLAGIHHQRIAYTEPVEKTATPRLHKDINGPDEAKSEGTQKENSAGEEERRREGEKLKRLGVE
jgi:cyclic-di-AMP phosphodiesterase PgpH